MGVIVMRNKTRSFRKNRKVLKRPIRPFRPGSKSTDLEISIPVEQLALATLTEHVGIFAFIVFGSEQDWKLACPDTPSLLLKALEIMYAGALPEKHVVQLNETCSTSTWAAIRKFKKQKKFFSHHLTSQHSVDKHPVFLIASEIRDISCLWTHALSSLQMQMPFISWKVEARNQALLELANAFGISSSTAAYMSGVPLADIISNKEVVKTSQMFVSHLQELAAGDPYEDEHLRRW